VKGGASRRATYQAHEWRSRGSVGPRPTRVIPRRGERHERIGLWPPGNPGSRATDSEDARILEIGRDGSTAAQVAGGAERERCGGQGPSGGGPGYRGGKPAEDEKPKGATGMKQGWKGWGWSKASRGRENLKTPHSRGRQTRCSRYLLPHASKGQPNLKDGRVDTRRFGGGIGRSERASALNAS
jgi:hypothetical protein